MRRRSSDIFCTFAEMGQKIRYGQVVLDPWIVLASALISWLVCEIGCVCMAEMEAMLSQQLLFSVVATIGVAEMH